MVVVPDFFGKLEVKAQTRMRIDALTPHFDSVNNFSLVRNSLLTF
jgi:hypothetical protein